MAVTPLTPQDVADCVNSLNIDKATFTQFIQAAALLNQRNELLAQISAATATANAAAVTAASQIATLNTQLAAVDAQYQALVG